MLVRFSLYGFLKNQQYYEPFLLLAFLQMGLNYTIIGLLIGFRELMVNLMEVPSGAVADVRGRRNSMIISFMAYIIHFAVIGITGIAAINNSLPFNAVLALLFFSMLFFAVGDAFRTGTHKAIIFAWLREPYPGRRRKYVRRHRPWGWSAGNCIVLSPDMPRTCWQLPGS